MKRKQKEIHFCKDVLKPLLEALRPHILNLRYRHGNLEFGKDFTFSYFNPLNQRINVGIQAKWGDIAGKSSSVISGIVNQITIAFTMSYKNRPGGPERYLNELFLICSGKYTYNAIEIIEKTLDRNLNVHFLDGTAVGDLRKKITLSVKARKGETKRALNALLIELDQNIKIAEEIDLRMEEFIQERKHFLTGYRLNCLQNVLDLDIDDKWLLDEAVIQWNNLTIQNNLLNQIRLTVVSPEQMKERKQTLWNQAKKDIKGLADLRKYVVSYLDSLQ